MYDNGTLKSIGATVNDQSAAVATSALTTAVAVAKMAIGVPTARAKNNLCSKDVYIALKTIKTGQAALLNPATADKARTNWSAAITAAKTVVTITKTYVSTRRVMPRPP